MKEKYNAKAPADDGITAKQQKPYWTWLIHYFNNRKVVKTYKNLLCFI